MVRQDTASEQGGDAWRQARRFRRRLQRVLAGRGLAVGAGMGAWGIGLALLAARFVDWPVTIVQRLLWMLGVIVLSALSLAVATLRRTPSVACCLAAVDAAGAAGGLVMCLDLPGAQAWNARATCLPRVDWRGRRVLGNLALALLFCLPTVFLPRRFFIGPASEAVPKLEPLVERVADRVEQAQDGQLLPEPVLAAFSNHLARLGERGDAVDPARTLEALDHIEDELSRTLAAQAEALAGEQAALQASLALMEGLSDRLDEFSEAGMPSDEVVRALAEFFEHSALPASLSSNLLAACRGVPSLTPAELERLTGMLREAGAWNEARLLRLGELGRIEGSACRGASCTNAAACAAALARLLEGDDPAAEAAVRLASLSGRPGAGGITRGRGDAPLTWTDPSSRETVAFREETLTSSRPPPFDRARLEGLSAAAPDVSERPAVTRAGALGEAGEARGGSSRAPILPRHRQTVARFFE